MRSRSAKRSNRSRRNSRISIAKSPCTDSAWANAYTTGPTDFARGFPDEDEQWRIYQRIGERVSPESVTIRLFDLGGDKSLPGGHEEPNPQLGLRSIRLLLARESVLRTQLRAILRANTKKNLRIMVPMVTASRSIS